MARSTGTDHIIVKPKANVYTVLAAVGVVVAALGLFVLIQRAKVIMPPGIF
jgi:hypothetical protein